MNKTNIKSNVELLEFLGYTPPSDNKLCNILSSRYHEDVGLVKKFFKDNKKLRPTVSYDHWTRAGGKSYLGITCAFPMLNVSIQTVTLCLEECKELHTSDNIEKQIFKRLDEYGVKPKALVTDNATNVAKSKRTYIDKHADGNHGSPASMYQTIHNINCVCHCLNLVSVKYYNE